MFQFLQKNKRLRHVSAYSYSEQRGQKTTGTIARRIKILSVFFMLLAILMVGRLAKLQIVDGNYYQALASDQHEIFKRLYPERGTIYAVERDVDGQEKTTPLATNRELKFIYAIPKDIDDPEAVSQVLMENLDFSEEIKNIQPEAPVAMSAELTEQAKIEEQEKLDQMAEAEAHEMFLAKLRERLSKKDDPFEPIKHRVTDAEVAKLQSYNLKGIAWVNEPARYYPEGMTGSQLLGFVGHSSDSNMLKGYYGIEGNYNKELSGEPGFLRSESDGAGHIIALANKDFQEAKNGSDVVLTIDRSIEYYACEQLAAGVKDMGATNGSVVIMNPQTGAIIAMCNYPDFDPNNYNKVKDISLFNNSVLIGNYEPGSVFKPVTLAAGLDSGKVTPFSGYNDTGLERIAGFNIMNSDGKANGWQTMTQILEKSLNTGTIFVARQVGVDAFRAYVKAFGFGVQTGIDLSPETEGNIKSLDSTGEIYLATGSFGQGLTVTPLQIARAYSAIVNGGRLLVPFVVDKIVAPDGTITQTTPKVVGQPISEKTSKQVASMLVSVVQNGHAKRAQIPGYLIGGKTGTAQIPDLVNGGYGLDTIHTFAGFGPLSDPRFVIVVKMDKVQKVEFAEGSVIPVFTKIAKYMINYYGIPPEVK